MKISELSGIIDYLPDGLEVAIGTCDSSLKNTLIKEEWGNHDGRYNAKCTLCGWQSADIPATGEMPSGCPKCNGQDDDSQRNKKY